MYFRRSIYEEIICTTNVFLVFLNLELETSRDYPLPSLLFPLEFSEPSPLLLVLLTIAFFLCSMLMHNLHYRFIL